MKKTKSLGRYVGRSFASLALTSAETASKRISLIFFQDEIPEKLRKKD